jgi:hypothetical protein
MSPEERAAAHAQAVHAGETSRAGVDPSMPGDFASMVERQQLVAELWIKDLGVAEIARTLGVSRETARRDVLAYQRESAVEHLPDLENARARTLELHRRVQQEAWMLFAQLPPQSLNKPKALEAILAAEAQIGRVEGLFAAESASAAGIVELQRLVVQTLQSVGGPELVRAFLAELARTSQTALGSAITASLQPPAVNADTDTAVGDVLDAVTLEHVVPTEEATPTPMATTDNSPRRGCAG